jgi:cysteinyl-tRNA synthetase
MPLKLYNTLTNKIDEFKEINKGKVGLYMCGPTVYDHAHIGNFRSNIFQDLVKRYLIYLGYEVKHVMNITDIDDKTIRKSIDQNIPIKEVTKKYTESFFEDLEALNILKADVYPRATEHIPEMKNMVSTLIEKGYAYKQGDSVYFNIEKFDNYGRLANIKKENLKTGVSVDNDEYDKNNVQDFVLWKGKKEKEPFWETEFGEGRPGWHIECSAMSTKYLGEHFDIHIGGVDLIFPHHENEIAQSECSTNKKFVNYWLHCQHLIFDNKKMSKSLKNFYTLKDLLKKGYDPMEIRYLLISTHYRKLLNFTFDGLVSAGKSLKRIKDFLFALEGLKVKEGSNENIVALIEQYEDKFKDNMDDDLNVSGALGVLFEFIHEINRRIDDLKSEDVKSIISLIKRINSVFGIIEDEKKTSLIDEEAIKELVEERDKAKKEKNYSLADKIRDELKEKGIVLIDTPDGVRWKIEK